MLPNTFEFLYGDGAVKLSLPARQVLNDIRGTGSKRSPTFRRLCEKPCASRSVRRPWLRS